MIPEETEILLDPEKCFKVQSVIEVETTVVKLKMMDLPLILSQYFCDVERMILNVVR